MEVSETSSRVPNYHIYKHVWDAGTESLIQTKAIDIYTVTVKRWLVICYVNITSLFPFSLENGMLAVL